MKEAMESYIFEVRGKRIGVYACAEHESSIVSDICVGANPYDHLESFEHVSILKSKRDYVIVLYHGGKEHYRYPSPNLQKICRKFAEKGANLIICQHTHCVGCEEKYHGSIIVYGQGNFIFDDKENEFWQTSLLVEIRNNFEVRYIPLLKLENKVRMAMEEADEVLKGFWERSEEIQNIGCIEEKYTEFANSKVAEYLRICLENYGLPFRIMNKVCQKLFDKLIPELHYNRRALLAIRNIIECEAHHELFLVGLKRKIEI